MEAIFASKLYKASPRKERIQAALVAPGNFNLVEQLSDSLDVEYQTPENLGLPEQSQDSEEVKEQENDLILDEEINPETDLVTMDDLKNGPSNVSSAPSKPEADKPEGEYKPKADHKQPEEGLIPESPANDVSEQPEASTKVTSTTIADLNLLKATLNSREDTAGVSRIAEKENEVWIYYNDDTNLNNVMTDVIEYLMNNGYESFEFNRLARSDNAVVFEITKSTD